MSGFYRAIWVGVRMKGVGNQESMMVGDMSMGGVSTIAIGVWVWVRGCGVGMLTQNFIFNMLGKIDNTFSCNIARLPTAPMCVFSLRFIPWAATLIEAEGWRRNTDNMSMLLWTEAKRLDIIVRVWWLYTVMMRLKHQYSDTHTSLSLWLLNYFNQVIANFEQEMRN